MSNAIYCLECNSLIKSKSAKKFCKQSCAAIYNNRSKTHQSSETKQRISLGVNKARAEGRGKLKLPIKRRLKYVGPYTPIKRRVCTNCEKEFWATTPSKVTCSDICKHQRSAFNNVKKQHIPFYNPFDNETIFLHSNWEVIVATWLVEQNIKWSRPHKVLYWFDGQTSRRYLPDFLVHDINLYVDVKNPIKMKQDKNKLKILCSEYNLLVGNIDQVKSGIMAALL